VEFILPSLLASVGLYMGKSTLLAFNTKVSPVFYTALVAQPSTGKSGAMGLLSSAIDMIENYLNISLDNSHQVNCPTIEALIELLKDHPELICKLILLHFYNC
jgi:hypothetical protein